MATRAGTAPVLDINGSITQTSKMRGETLVSKFATAYPQCVDYYKMQAYDSGAGWVSWVNNTGDNVNRPTAVGTFGDTFVVAHWCTSGT